jgi:hypothetical protein
MSTSRLYWLLAAWGMVIPHEAEIDWVRFVRNEGNGTIPWILSTRDDAGNSVFVFHYQNASFQLQLDDKGKTEPLIATNAWETYQVTTSFSRNGEALFVDKTYRAPHRVLKAVCDGKTLYFHKDYHVGGSGAYVTISAHSAETFKLQWEMEIPDGYQYDGRGGGTISSLSAESGRFEYIFEHTFIGRPATNSFRGQPFAMQEVTILADGDFLFTGAFNTKDWAWENNLYSTIGDKDAIVSRPSRGWSKVAQSSNYDFLRTFPLPSGGYLVYGYLRAPGQFADKPKSGAFVQKFDSEDKLVAERNLDEILDIYEVSNGSFTPNLLSGTSDGGVYVVRQKGIIEKWNDQLQTQWSQVLNATRLTIADHDASSVTIAGKCLGDLYIGTNRFLLSPEENGFIVRLIGPTTSINLSAEYDKGNNLVIVSWPISFLPVQLEVSEQLDDGFIRSEELTYINSNQHRIEIRIPAFLPARFYRLVEKVDSKREI